MVWLEVAPQLRFLLPARWRAGVAEVAAAQTASLGHIVQSVGIPLTEVGALRVAGQTVPVVRRAEPGELVEVLTRSRPQPLDGPPRLLLDVHLGALVRRLRAAWRGHRVPQRRRRR